MPVSHPTTGSIFLISGADVLRHIKARALSMSLLSRLLCMTAISFSPVASTQDWDLKTLMAALHQIKSSSATFVERKQLKFLMGQLQSTGTLRYEAPDRLEKITLTPTRETFSLNGEIVTGTERHGEPYTLSLMGHPEIASLVEGIRSTLSGDLATLGQYYSIDFSGAQANWQLTLRPREPTVAARISTLVLSGRETQITTVGIQETDGDQSVMLITPDGP